MSAYIAKGSGSFKMEHDIVVAKNMDLVSNRNDSWIWTWISYINFPSLSVLSSKMGKTGNVFIVLVGEWSEQFHAWLNKL